MVRHTTNLEGLHFVLASDAAQKRPKSFAQVRWNQGTTLFGAEYTMVVGAYVGHEAYSAVPSGLMQHLIGVPPTLKRWAIFVCPSGTKRLRASFSPRISDFGLPLPQ